MRRRTQVGDYSMSAFMWEAWAEWCAMSRAARLGYTLRLALVIGHALAWAWVLDALLARWLGP
jgi:hypothetical protein